MIFIAIASLLIWLGLLLFWGQFWLGVRLSPNEKKLESYPNIWAVIPARDEADVIADSLGSIFQQDYPGKLSVVLVDDNSCDDTAKIAQETANQFKKNQQFNLILGHPLPEEWKGKLWALKQGIDYAKQQALAPDYILLTDADIQHHSSNLTELITKAETENLDLVSLMVLLRCQSFWEKLLIPAFVFFFQKLYPFKLANNSQSFVAAAAGGCILIKADTLDRIGGIASLKNSLIDDCTLARKVKSNQGKIWLGLTEKTISLRPYDSLKSIWDMVARTAFNQLNYSWLLLMGTILGMALVYLVPLLAVIWGIVTQNMPVAIIGLITWIIMSLAYFPTIKLYRLFPLWSFCLSGVAFLYGLMTIDSAIKHLRGKGGFWKGRVYQ
ncbi:Glycosyl transferase family 2 [Hyella patelloides LEGE 07179]|uniref:Glycosyl transferase family 2 n=1 Tax=Hyella patelloides LEGE 07179 TaxID=945734 RepID=A0A563VNQ7_9CYAN|nr:glycosyltransferase [Hyella patelloides]VEP13102.1 Glycosyl transferase family 2 [Hyella patelloides LEGE 07179]